MWQGIPFFEFRVQTIDLPLLGLVPIDPWGTLVAIGIVVGLEMARARGIKQGFEPRDIVDAAAFIVAMGFVVGHLVTVVFYEPQRLTEDGIWALLRVWEGFSSLGGFVGAVLGAWMFYRWIRPRPALAYADVICFGFPFGWFFGRLGCGVVHDHVGALTTFPLAMNFDRGWGWFAEGSPWISGVRHELGLYEAAATLLICGLFWLWGRKPRPPGFFLSAFGLLYAPIRFGLDFLRNTDLSTADARYAALTPAQWGMLIMFAAAAALRWRMLSRRDG